MFSPGSYEYDMAEAGDLFQDAESGPAADFGDIGFVDISGVDLAAALETQTPHCTACGNRGYQFTAAGVDFPCACGLDRF